MIKNMLNNLFKPTEQRTMYGKIKSRLDAGMYEIEEDHTGQIYQAYSTDFYPPGVLVMIQDGIILRRGKRAGTHKHYEV